MAVKKKRGTPDVEDRVSLESLEAVSTRTVNHVLNLSGPTVRKLTVEGILPTNGNKGHFKYNLLHAVPAYIEYIANGNTNNKVADSRKRKEDEQVRRLKLANDEYEGKLVSVDRLKQFLMEVAVAFCADLTAISGRLSKDLAGENNAAKIKEMIDDEIRSVREALTARLEAGRHLQSPGEAGEAAPEEKPKRVGKRSPRSPSRKRRTG